MDFSTIRDVMSIGSPLIAFIVLVVGLRFHAKRASEKDVEHDKRIGRLEDKVQEMQVRNGRVDEIVSGINKRMGDRFDGIERTLAEISRRLNSQ